MAKTEMGLDENVEGALCYLLGFITGLVFYIMEPKSKFVKFHAMQSIIVFLPLMIIGFLFSGILGLFFWGPIWVIISLIGWIVWILFFILWLILMLKAYKGEKFKLPIAGDIAEKNS